MRSMLTTLSAAAAAAVFIATPALAGERLDDAQIRALFSDTVHDALTARGADFIGYYMADGTMKGDVANGKYTDEGTWEVADGKWCRQWKEWNEGARKCFVIEHVSGNEYRSIADGGTGTTTFRKR